MKKILLVIAVLLLLFPSICLASTQNIDLKATGFEWVEFTPQEKQQMVIGMLALFNLNEDYDLEKAVFSMDLYYKEAYKIVQDNPELKEEDILSVPCFFLLRSILNSKETDWDAKSVLRKDEGE